jgi:hypothetical protein
VSSAKIIGIEAGVEDEEETSYTNNGRSAQEGVFAELKSQPQMDLSRPAERPVIKSTCSRRCWRITSIGKSRCSAMSRKGIPRKNVRHCGASSNSGFKYSDPLNFIGRGFAMIRLESSGNDCTMGAGFRENSVYSTYTSVAWPASGLLSASRKLFSAKSTQLQRQPKCAARHPVESRTRTRSNSQTSAPRLSRSARRGVSRDTSAGCRRSPAS